ncbi:MULTISPECIES: LytTR family DNA-binding domain-containing protein [Allofournierella]|uniref:Stage 0 sporulation protein A homolog n=1 Tax=Allofournierella massiliensis TaxID=1650663 RepID=A0ABT7UTN4_9FIRM|nr:MULTISPECIES: LytTR family DNA-binding domain-containing protein [Fournierella]MDM8202249.1 LytTR family DNA-binding domain-containing protein [Fournierella massiliensis]
MRNIAIVEDEDLAAQALIDHIKQYEAQTGQSFQIFRFANGADFLQDYRAVYAVVFLDVQMPRMNGLETALQLRRCDKNVSIIFITNLVQYALKGYEVDAVSYLIKPVSYYDFSMKFKKALDIYLLNEDRSFTVNTPGGLCRISTDKLMYVEIMNHRLFYHLIDDVIEMTGVLSGVEQQLSRFGFLRCNKCYLVNPKFIVKVKGSTVQVGDNLLQISRPRRAAFLAELANWYAGSAGGE